MLAWADTRRLCGRPVLRKTENTAAGYLNYEAIVLVAWLMEGGAASTLDRKWLSTWSDFLLHSFGIVSRFIAGWS